MNYPDTTEVRTCLRKLFLYCVVEENGQKYLRLPLSERNIMAEKFGDIANVIDAIKYINEHDIPTAKSTASALAFCEAFKQRYTHMHNPETRAWFSRAKNWILSLANARDEDRHQRAQDRALLATALHCLTHHEPEFTAQIINDINKRLNLPEPI